MFDTDLVDVLVLLPAIMALAFGFLIQLAGGSERVNSKTEKLLGLAFLLILTAICFYLEKTVSNTSVVVLDGLFKVDGVSAATACAISVLCLMQYVGACSDSQSKSRTSDLFIPLGLLLALIFSQNLIFVFIFSELVLLKTLTSRTEKFCWADLQSARIRFAGLILILGAVAINYGMGTPSTLSFLQSSSEALYSADYLFLIGSIFILSGLIKILWSFFETDFLKLSFQTLLAGLSFVLVTLKYSSADLFAVLEDVQAPLQWLCIIVLLATVSKIHQATYFLQQIKFIFLSALLLSVIFILPLIFDGEGLQTTGLAYLFISLTGVLFLLQIQSSLERSKGASVILDDIMGLSERLPKRSLLIVLVWVLATAFPLGLGFLSLAMGLKTSFQAGFYWVGFWTLFSMIGLWTTVPRILNSVFFEKPDSESWFLWEDKAVADVNLLKVAAFAFVTVISPVLFLLLFR